MSNHIYPDTPKLMAQQRYDEMSKESEIVRRIKGVDLGSRIGRRTRRPGGGLVRRLAIAMILVALSGLVFVSIVAAAGV